MDLGAIEDFLEGPDAAAVGTTQNDIGSGLDQAGASVIDLESGRIQGSLNQLLSDGPVILDVACTVAGQDTTTRLPFNPADPEYRFDHMEVLALMTRC